MDKHKNITILNKGMYGIKKPLLIIEGISKKEKMFIIKEDSKEIESDTLYIDGKNEFVIKANLSPNSKKIEVFLIENNKELLVVKLRNNIFLRISLKMKGILKKILSKIKCFLYLIYKAIRLLWREYHFLVPPSLWEKYFKLLIQRLKTNGVTLFYNPFIRDEYQKWIECYELQKEEIELKYKPLISILIPVYNIDRKNLSECLDSILNQSYKNFEVCLADDKSTNQETIDTLKEYELKDSRIKVIYRKTNGHISKATNSALEIAKGEFVALVDNDDTLSMNALYENVKVLNSNKKIDFIYSDEDKLDLKGRRCDPNFKPDFSPDTLMSLNYICHLAVIRKKIIDDIGGFTVGLEGAQDHDLFLRIAEKTGQIYHIPKILYHWRMVKGSTSMSISNKTYAADKGKEAIEQALKRRKLDGIVEKDEQSTYYKIKYNVTGKDKISIIIPTKDYAGTLKTCIDSIYAKTNYKNFEIIIVNNNSQEQETFDLFEKYKKQYDNFKIIDANFEFNYSKINNIAIKECTGDYIVLLNNDTEIITENWLQTMLGYASLKHIGAVGPKLLYPDYSVQHAGVILGLGGVASHAYIGSSREDLGMYGRLRVPYNYSAVTAACLMIKKSKFLEVNGLEEDLMVAYNDIDFNIKLLKKGYYNIFLPQVELIHFESKSRGLDTTSEKYKRFIKESNYMFNKWKSEIENDVFYNPNFSKKGWFMLDKKKALDKK